MRLNARNAIICALIIALAGCATLPQREATAFKTIASADADSFGKATASDLRSRTEAAVIQSAATGISVETMNCDQSTAPAGTMIDKTQCEVKMTGVGTPPLALVEGAPRTRKLIKAVATYAAAMADLAEAKDVAAAKANVDAAEKSIETLFTISGVAAPAAGFTKAIAAIAKGRMTKARRNALLAAAREADPAIKVAADQLTEISKSIKGNVLDSAAVRLNRYQSALDRATETGKRLQAKYSALPAGAGRADARDQLRVMIDGEQARRVDAGNALVRTAVDIRLARGMETDFSGLAKAHTALINALDKPEVGMTSAFDGINSFLDAVSSAKGD